MLSELQTHSLFVGLGGRVFSWDFSHITLSHHFKSYINFINFSKNQEINLKLTHSRMLRLLIFSILVSIALSSEESEFDFSGIGRDEFEAHLREHGFSEEKIRQILPVSYILPFLLDKQMFGFLIAFNH